MTTSFSSAFATRSNQLLAPPPFTGEPLDARRLLVVETMESEITTLFDTPFVERLIHPTNGEDVGQAHLFTAVSEPSADFDEDGDVDGNDFLIWQRGESPIPLSASDLAAWQLNFGSSITLASSTAIPEPSAIVMAVCCLIGLARRPCQR